MRPISSGNDSRLMPHDLRRMHREGLLLGAVGVQCCCRNVAITMGGPLLSNCAVWGRSKACLVVSREKMRSRVAARCGRCRHEAFNAQVCAHGRTRPPWLCGPLSWATSTCRGVGPMRPAPCSQGRLPLPAAPLQRRAQAGTAPRRTRRPRSCMPASGRRWRRAGSASAIQLHTSRAAATPALCASTSGLRALACCMHACMGSAM